MATNSDSHSSYYHCSMCLYTGENYPKLIKHVARNHKHDPNFIVHCGVHGCAYSTKVWNAFKCHYSKRHRNLQETDANDEEPQVEILDTSQEGLGLSHYQALNYVLALQTKHNISNSSVDIVVDATKELVQNCYEDFRKQTETVLRANNVDADLLKQVKYCDHFLDLSTQFKRDKAYKHYCGLIEPLEVVLGYSVTPHRAVNARKKCFGYFVPLDVLLHSILNMPEIWRCVQNTPERNTNVMYELSDGEYFEHHVLFQRKPQALKLILSTDDIEVVNPIGAHTKKHKLTMFYLTLGNIPYKYRSKLNAIWVIAIAKSSHMKRFGCEKLLENFVSTICQLASGGINMKIDSMEHLIEGTLVMVAADTPAANWLGGFKEGVSFSRKPCRICTTSYQEMQSSSKIDKFQIREMDQHLERCNDLEEMSKPARKYWSKMWGINKKSCLCVIPNFKLSESLVQDPMHILLEGVVQSEIQLFLCYAIFIKKYFTLEYLNHSIVNFQYGYLEMDTPEPFSKSNLTSEGKLKQTAGALLTLLKIFPFILGHKIPEIDKKWENLLRLFHVTHLVISPYIHKDMIGKLEQLVFTHHECFKEEYPKASFTPKMHFMLHLPRQMKLFGPGRNQWCMRFEAKHGFFKGLKTKSFRNVIKTVFQKHQRWLSFQCFGYLGKPSENFLYSGDIIGKGTTVKFCENFPALIGDFVELTGLDPQEEVYYCKDITIQGCHYKCGCAISLNPEDCQFGLLIEVIVVQDEKFFIFEKLETTEFRKHILSYVVTATDSYVLVPFKNLRFYFPHTIHFFKEEMCIMNTNSPFYEFI